MFFVSIISILFLTACSPAATQPPPTATFTQPPTLIPTLTNTPTLTLTATPLVNQEDLRMDWGPAFHGALVLNVGCDQVLLIADTFNQGEISSSEVDLGLLTVAMFILPVKENFDIWKPSSVVAPYKEKLWEDWETLFEVTKSWNNGDITSEDVPGKLSATCSSLYEILEEMGFAAMDAGMSEESLNELIVDIQEFIEE